jgi:DNA-binding transcriptional ArsR family regulator
MALREAGLLSTRREGKFVFYRLEKPEIIEIVQLAGRLEGLARSAIVVGARTNRGSCGCPTCAVPIAAQ